LALLKTWPLLALALLVASAAAAQPQLPVRQRQDRRISLPATPEEPVPEVRVASGNLTTLVFNAPLDRDTLELDRTRFKLADTGERILNLEPATELGSGERLVVKVRFKDRALPAQAVFALVSHAAEMDGRVEVDRRANTPEALLAALAQKEAELEELKARHAGSGPANLVLSGWLTRRMRPRVLIVEASAADTSGLEVDACEGYEGGFSALVAIQLRNLSGQAPWVQGEARLASKSGAPVKVLSVQMKAKELAPGEEGLVVLETKTPPWFIEETFTVELVDASGRRRISFNLVAKK
jgi:uncharacterized protein (TIGR02268 family)